MGRTGRWTPAAVVILMAFAGCADEASHGQSGPIGDNENTGRVAGTVLDDSGLPVEGARVGLVAPGWNASAPTGPDGAFAFSGVPPGGYDLVASKIGFTSAVRRLAVAPGDNHAGLDLVLVAIPSPLEAFSEVLPVHRGFIACAAKLGAATFTTVPFCEVDPNHDVFFDFEVVRSRGLVSVVVELAWTPSTPGTATHLRHELWKNPNCSTQEVLVLTLPLGCDPDVIYARQSGPSPLQMIFGNLTAPFVDSVEVEGPTVLTHYAHVSRDDDPLVVLVFQQPVEHYVSIFYNMEPPPGYTSLAPQDP